MNADQLPESPYKTILFCTDFSENADHAFGYAVDAATRRPGCTLYLLHVIPEPEAQFWKSYIYEVEGVDEKARADVDEKINTVYRRLVPAHVDFRVEIRIGNAFREILDFARKVKADLIVLGRHGTSSIGEFFFGDVTEKVARKAPCAVLLVPLRD